MLAESAVKIKIINHSIPVGLPTEVADLTVNVIKNEFSKLSSDCSQDSLY